jgi:hypothetical protein
MNASNVACLVWLKYGMNPSFHLTGNGVVCGIRWQVMVLLM